MERKIWTLNKNALLRHTGLNLTEASSGKWKGQLSLSKRGSPRLRRFLYLITMCMVMSIESFKALYKHNVQVKKLKIMKSIMKLCGKLARLLVGMACSQEAYNRIKSLHWQLNNNSRKLVYSQDYKESTEYREMLNKRAPTRSVRKADLHPLDRCNEGMKGHLTL